MLVSGLLPYGSATRTTATNVRFRWKYIVGSDIFLVNSDDLDTTARWFPDLRNRATMLKITRTARRASSLGRSER